jgi:cell division protein ZapA (FtsZ GTPase activity inhibitor)
VLRRVVDAQSDPQGKALLVSGQINQFQCQACGMVNSVSSSLLYHDAKKEILIAFVPMDIAMKQGISEEKMIGDLMNELTRNIPKEQFRAYMFNPKRALTLKGLIEQVMEADGITKEMIQENEKRVRLVQDFIQAESEEALIELVKQHDADINVTTFQTVSLMAQRFMQMGQQQAVAHLAAIQEVLVENSSYGQELAAQEAEREAAIRSVAQDLEAFGENSQRSDLIDLIVQYADDDNKLQAVVGLARGAFDYEFFMEFTSYISKAPADEREKLEELRELLQDLTAALDEQTKMLMQQKVQFLQALLTSEDHQKMLVDNLSLIDDNFMSVLSANLQEAQRRKDQAVEQRLRQIYDAAVAILQSQMSPELSFINDLLSADDPATMNTLIEENIAEFDEELLQVIDAVEQVFATQGQQDAVDKLNIIRAALTLALS